MGMPRRWVSVNVLILGCALGVMPSALAISLDFATFDAPGAKNTFASGINDAGQIVGFFKDASGKDQGYVATPIR